MVFKATLLGHFKISKQFAFAGFPKNILNAFMLNILDIILSLTIVYLFYLFQFHTFILLHSPRPLSISSLHVAQREKTSLLRRAEIPTQTCHTPG
jgi:hypothetical protein